MVFSVSSLCKANECSCYRNVCKTVLPISTYSKLLNILTTINLFCLSLKQGWVEHVVLSGSLWSLNFTRLTWLWFLTIKSNKSTRNTGKQMRSEDFWISGFVCFICYSLFRSNSFKWSNVKYKCFANMWMNFQILSSDGLRVWCVK